MNKRIIACIIAVLLLFSTMTVGFTSSAQTANKTIKKIISIVYDDSGSMTYDEKYAYASYSLQNLVSLMNPQDEINVVKMSDSSSSNSIDLSNNSRQSSISSIENYKAKGSTPFAAVDTAANWLKSRKADFSDSQSVEFWLVIITDGQFENMPDFSNYLHNLKESMGNSKYEGILVAIGNDLQQNVINAWNNVTGNHLIKATNSDEIVTAMSEVSGLILGQGGKESSVEITPGSDGKSITFNSPFPLRKFIVYEQNQNVAISSISVDGVKVSASSDFSSKNPGSAKTNARTVHCESDDIIPAGNITVNFANTIDVSSNKLKILTDSAVNIKFTVLDKSGKEIDLDNSTLIEGDYVEFSAVVTSCIDNKPINLKNWANQLSAQLIVNEQSIAMKYNASDNTFYGGFNIKSGSNIAYSIVTLPGYFRAKSDILNVYPIETINNASAKVSSSTLEIPYKYCKEYEEVGKFEYTVSGGTINGICNFEFKNLPKGIKASVNGIQTDENGKISLKIHNDVPADVVFLRNKDYSEIEDKKITINVTSEQYVLKWAKDSITEIILKPIKREISFEIKEQNTKIDLNKLSNTVIFDIGVLGNGDYLSKDELETLKLNFDNTQGIEYQTEIAETDGHYVIRVSIKKSSITLLVKTGDISCKLNVETQYSENGETSLDYTINDSILKFLFPLLLLVLIVVGIGYLPGVKKRIANKKYCISANDEIEQIIVNTASRILPYACEKGYASVLSVKATNRKDKLEVLKDDIDAISLNGEDQSDEKQVFIRLDDVLVVKQDNNVSTYKLMSTSDESFGDEFGDLGDDDLFDSSSSSSDDTDDSLF